MKIFSKFNKFFRESKWIMLIMLAFFLLWSVLCKYTGNNILTAVTFSVWSLLLFAFSIMLAQKWLKRTWGKVIAFSVIFVLGVWAYRDAGNIIVSACAALAEFFPSRGSYETEYTGSAEMIAFYVLSYFFALSFLVAVFGRKLINSYLRFRATVFDAGNCRVFWCNIPGEKELILAEDLLENGGNQCIFSVNEFAVNDANILMEDLNFHQHLLYLRKPGQLHRETLKAPAHFFITDDCDWNIRMAQKVWQEMVKKKRNGKTDFYVRISGGHKGYWTEKWAEKMQKSSAGQLEIHLLQESELTARRFVKDNPLLNSPGIEIVPDTGKVKGSFKILLTGFDELGESILRETICDGQFLHLDPEDCFSVDVIDNADTHWSNFAARCREAVREYHISFQNIDVQSGKFYEFLEEKLADYNRIIICFKDNALNMDIAAEIIECAKFQNLECANRLFVHLDGSYEKDDHPEELILFGATKNSYCREVIVHEELDRDARAINRHYNNGKDNWSELSLFNRDSNRSTAAGLYNLCRLMNIYDPQKEFDPEIIARIQQKDLGDVLAETEHLRWSAFLYMRGIRRWDITGHPGKIAKANDIVAHRRHAALVPFSQLPEINAKSSGDKDFQENNRQIVQLLTTLFDKTTN